MLDKEDFSITPKSVQSHNARQVNKSDKSEHLKNALTLSPIVAEAPDEAKVLPTEGKILLTLSNSLVFLKNFEEFPPIVSPTVS